MLFLTLAHSYKIQTALGRSLATSKRSIFRRIASSEVKSWHFVHMEDEISIEELQRHYIPVSVHSYVTRNWYRIFCSESNLTFLEKNYGASIADIKPEDKWVSKTAPRNEVMNLLVETDKSFDPSYFPLKNMNFTRLISTVYSVETNNGVEAVSQLSSINSVITVLPGLQLTTMNRYSTGRIQGGGSTPQLSQEGVYETPRYMNNRGLDGTGVVVGVADTGIDIKSTYFYREKDDVIFNEYNPNHHKIVSYYTKFGDKKDENGHGTHVAGIIAGHAQCEDCTDRLYNGVAPNAKLAFFDVGIGDSPSLNMYDLEIFVQKLNESNATIYSESIGRDVMIGHESTMTIHNYLADALALELSHLPMFIAAGNSGLVTNKSVNSFSSGKNLISVANIQNMYALSFETPTQLPSLGVIFYEGNNASFLKYSSTSVSLMDKDNPFVKRNVSSIANAKDGDIVITNSTDCNQFGSLQPSVVIFTGDVDPECKNIKVPSFIINQSLPEGEAFIQPAIYNVFEDRITDSSSNGPTILGLKKPDLAAVGGFVVSAKSEVNGSLGHNSRISLIGTSMATPMVAGAAALVRQYLQDGWFNGARFEPNGCTMKALMIASCDPLKNPVLNPIVTEGHGEVNIRNILNVEKESNNGKQMGIGQDIKMRKGKHLVATIEIINKSNPVRIALSYNDILTPTESYHNIMVDVSMYVEFPSGKGRYGNGEEEMESTLESVIIDPKDVEIGKYKIHLICSGVDNEEVSGSVVVIGSMKEDKIIEFKEIEEAEGCIEGCNNRGKCEKNKCKCDRNYIGSSCQNNITEISSEETINLKSLEMRAFKIKARKGSSVHFTISFSLKYNASSYVFVGSKYPESLHDYSSTSRIINQENKTIEEFSANAGDDNCIYFMVYNSNAFPEIIKISNTTPDFTLVLAIVIPIAIIILAAVTGFLIWFFLFRNKDDISSDDQERDNEVKANLMV